MEKKRIIGLMTGTSLDAVDIAICDFYNNDNNLQFNLLNYKEYLFSSDYKTFIKKIIDENSFIKDISQLNFYLSELFCDCILDFCENFNINLNSIDAISIHGQTVWHNPSKEIFLDRQISSTLQIASISAISSKLSKKVIGDFRSADIMLGGEGAPLIPIFDYYFLKSSTENIISLNIGGISNITYLPKNCNKNEIIAFDCGPGNVLIDSYLQEFTDFSFDRDGRIAAKGEIIESLSRDLKKIEFIYNSPPKSTGRELFNLKLIKKLIGTNRYSIEDVIATLTDFTAYSISYNINNFVDENSKIIVSGGGRKNKSILKRINYYLPNSSILLIDELGINGDAKEAIFIAFLGYLNILKIPGNISKITGALKEVVLGISADNF